MTNKTVSVDGGRDSHLLVGSGWGLKSRVERRFAPGTFASLVKVKVPKLAQTKLCNVDLIRGAAHTLWRQCFRHRAQERAAEFSSWPMAPMDGGWLGYARCFLLACLNWAVFPSCLPA